VQLDARGVQRPGHGVRGIQAKAAVVGKRLRQSGFRIKTAVDGPEKADGVPSAARVQGAVAAQEFLGGGPARGREAIHVAGPFAGEGETA